MKLLLAALLFLPAAAGAQETTDPRWTPWLGCWEIVLESAREAAAVTPPRRGAPAQPPRSTQRPQICVEPAPEGTTFRTRVGAQTPIEQRVIADGTDRPIVDEDCRGTERTEWSRDGLSLFARADMSCASDKANRRVSGLSILGPNETWIDIRAVDISGQETVRVRRYRRVAGSPRPARGRAQALSLEDVQEASSKVSARALEAALVETGSTFDLSSKRLIALDEAGVPAQIIDLIVALSYPDRFVVERPRAGDRAAAVPIFDDPFFLGWSFGYPMWSDIDGFYSPFYGSYWPSYYSPFGYSYLRGYDPRYFGGGSVIVIGEGGGSAPADRPSGAGRVVDGLGYTRIRPREAEVAPSGRPGTRSTSSGSSGDASSSGGSSSSSGGGSVSTQGSSSGGSGDGGGRTAQPR